MPSIIGETLAKIDGQYEVDVTNASWDIRRNVTQNGTGGGVKNNVGQPLASGSFDAVVSKVGSTSWLPKGEFSVQIYDKETRKIVVFSAERCSWEDLGAVTDALNGTTKKKIAWKAEEPVVF